jgi:hypothetical protein
MRATTSTLLACAAIAVLAGGGCVTMQGKQTLALGYLDETPKQATIADGVELTLDAVGAQDWRDEPALKHHLKFVDADTHAQASARGEGAQAAAATSQVLRSEDVAMIPIPAIRVSIANATDAPFPVGDLRFTARLLDRALPSLSKEEATTHVLRATQQRIAALSAPQNRDVVEMLRRAQATLPYVGPDVVVPPRTKWEGWISFRWEVDSAEELARLVRARALVIEATRGERRAEVSFSMERPQRLARCSDGTMRPFGECRPSYTQMEPEPAGPCIQQTRILGKIFLRQHWIGGNPVANTDVDRTLLLEPATHSLAMRAVAMRWAGALLIAGGIGGSVAAAIAIGRTYGTEYGPAGLGLLGVSVVGLGISLGSSRALDRAVEAYNEQALATGVCVARS